MASYVSNEQDIAVIAYVGNTLVKLNNHDLYIYDLNGLVLTHADRNGNVCTYTYDNRGRMTAQGSPGEGNDWHHIVEQSQITKSGFSPEQIHNTSNIIAVDHATENNWVL